MMEKCNNCNTLVVKMKTEMQDILMDHVKIISRIQKFVSTTEATGFRAIPDEMETRQEKDFHQNEEDGTSCRRSATCTLLCWELL